MPDNVSMYYPDFSMKHIFLTTPYMWEKSFPSLDINGKTLTWLQIIPISDAEYQYALEHGSNALDELLVLNYVSILNLNRPSVIDK